MIERPRAGWSLTLTLSAALSLGAWSVLPAAPSPVPADGPHAGIAQSAPAWYWQRGTEIAMAACRDGRLRTATARVIPDDAPAVGGSDAGVRVGSPAYVVRRWAQTGMRDYRPYWTGFWQNDRGAAAAAAFVATRCR